MNLMARDIRFRRVRFLLAALGLGLLLGIVVAMGGIEGGMIRDAVAFPESTGANVWVSQQNSGGPFLGQSGLPKSTASDVAAIPGVDKANALIFGTYTIPYGDSFKRVAIVGTEQGGLGQPGALTAGRLYNAGAREAVVDEALGLALGARFKLGTAEFEIVGLAQGMNYNRIPIVYLALDQAQGVLFSQQQYSRLMEETRDKFFAAFTKEEGARIEQRMDELIPGWIDETGNINAVLVRVATGYSPEDVAHDVAQSLNLDARTLEEELALVLSADVKRGHDQMLMFKTMLMIIAGVVLMLITYTNTIEKTRDIAILKVVGTPTRRIVGMIAQEAVLIGIVGAVIGSILIFVTAPRFPLPLVLRTEDIGVAFGGALVLCALGSLLAVRKALTIDPMVAMGR